jgi:hypothetical protein
MALPASGDQQPVAILDTGYGPSRLVPDERHGEDVAAALEGRPLGHEPNIRLGSDDLPRDDAPPGAPRRWSPQRPGDLGSPDDVPWGGAFGTPGPDTGFAFRLVRDRELPGSAHQRPDVEAVVVAVMSARASAIGRAPIASDVSAAIGLLELTDTTAESFAGIAHDHARLGAVVGAFSVQGLTA